MARKAANPKNSTSLQLTLFAPESEWAPPSLSTLPSWKGARRVAVDVETRDPHLREKGPGVRRRPAENYICGYSFAIDGGPAHYIPLKHLGGDNVEDPTQAWAYLAYQARHFDGELVVMNGGYDLDWLAQEQPGKPKIVFREARAVRDIMVAEALICELHNSYSMAAIAERWGLPGKNEALLREAAAAYNVDPKSGLWRLPGRFVGPYGEGDADLPLRILALQEAEIAAQDLGEIWDVESALLPVLVKMRRRGVLIDWCKLAEIEDWTVVEEREALEIVRHETGHRIEVGDVWKAQALAPALESIGITLAKTEKTAAPQIDKALLSSGEHPVLDAIGRARRVNKIRTTFAQSVHTYATNGRIHCTLNQMFGEREEGGARGARFGRMSSEHPNMQQVPSKDKGGEGKDWRKIYLPEEGQLWACADFSQQEPRMCAHFAHALRLPGAAEMVNRYRTDPLTDNHTLMAEITQLPRSAAKLIFLGIMYGMGGHKLCTDLGHPTAMKMTKDGRQILCAGEEGQRILDKFDQNAPFVKKLSKICEDVVKKRGYIKTVLGRRCRFPKDAEGNYDWTYRALNRLIQGSSADQVKKAIVDVDREGCYLQLQVHDELDFSTSSREEAVKVGAIMSDAIKMSLPFKVDVEVGRSWGEVE